MRVMADFLMQIDRVVAVRVPEQVNLGPGRIGLRTPKPLDGPVVIFFIDHGPDACAVVGVNAEFVGERSWV